MVQLMPTTKRTAYAMALTIPKECPTCADAGRRSEVRLYQINFDEAAVFCENQTCPFPLFSQSECPVVIPRSMAEIPSYEKPNRKRGCTDTDSLHSTCSVSSWTSKASTASSLSSSMSTPPPTISSRPYAWPPTLTTPVYKPTAVTPRKSQFYDWPTPIGSAQTSPALSFVSVTDKEVESVMNNLFSLDEASNLTPSPSPMVEKELTSSLHSDDASCGAKPLDEIDSFIAGLFSSGSGPSQSLVPPTSTTALPPPPPPPVAAPVPVSAGVSAQSVLKKLVAPSRSTAAKRGAARAEDDGGPPRKRLTPAAKNTRSPAPPLLQFNDQGTAVFTLTPPTPKVKPRAVTPATSRRKQTCTPTSSGSRAKASPKTTPKSTGVNAAAGIRNLVQQFLASTVNRRPASV